MLKAAMHRSVSARRKESKNKIAETKNLSSQIERTLTLQSKAPEGVGSFLLGYGVGMYVRVPSYGVSG